MNYIELSFAFSDEVDFTDAGLNDITSEKSEILNLKFIFHKNKNK